MAALADLPGLAVRISRALTDAAIGHAVTEMASLLRRFGPAEAP